MTPTRFDEGHVVIEIRDAQLSGNLQLPPNAKGLVIFAHGSGSSRLSPRNQYVASVLREHGLGTLLFDLLTPEEERIDEVTGDLRFDVEFLAARLQEVTRWVRQEPRTRELEYGYFGASTGAAAALIAAAQRPQDVRAVVSRGGRPDLAADWLGLVRAPTLLMVGGEDVAVVDFNEEALSHLSCEKELSIVPGATHLFEEPGALQQVAERAADWFGRYLHYSERGVVVSNFF